MATRKPFSPGPVIIPPKPQKILSVTIGGKPVTKKRTGR
jgi:hypothetical protein